MRRPATELKSSTISAGGVPGDFAWLSRLARVGRGPKLAIVGCLLLLACYSVFSIVRHVHTSHAAADFTSYYFGAQNVLDGQSYYEYHKMAARSTAAGITTEVPVVTAPVFSALPFVALQRLPYFTARVVWCIASVILLLGALIVVQAAWHTATGTRQTWWVAGLVFTLALIAVPALKYELRQGQNNIPMMVMLAVASLALVSNSVLIKRIGGICLAFGIVSKLFPAIVLGILGVARRWSLITVTVTAAIVLVVLFLPLTGASDYLVYPEYFRSTYYVGTGASVRNNLSLKHALLDLAPKGSVRTLVSAALLVPLLWVCYRAKVEYDANGSQNSAAVLLVRYWQTLLLMGAIMSSYWEYHMILTLPAYVLITCFLLQRRAAGKLLLVGIAVALATFLFPRVWNTGVSFRLTWADWRWVRIASLVSLFCVLELVASQLRREGRPRQSSVVTVEGSLVPHSL